MQEIEKSKISQIHKKNLISDNQKKIILIEKQIEEMKLIQFDRFKIINLENETNELKKQREEISEKKIEIMTNLNTLNLRIMEDNKVREKLTHIEVCPTCLQDVNSSYKENVVKRINSNIVLNESKIQEHKKQFGIISDKINETDKKIHSNEKEINKLKIIEIELRGIQEKQSQIQSILKENSYIEKDIEIINQQIEALKSAVNKLQKYENLYEINKKEFEYAINQEKIAEIKFAELNKEIEFLNKNIDFIREKIKKTKQIEEKLNYITELENWFTKKFIPLISFIEKNVMIKLKSEFTSLFQKWFSMLVSESFNARLQDDFTPIIEQQDYEIDYAYLSGGERTAVALAYRLALNQVINSLLSKIKTRDLVILDEPTDGFSDAQLEKMREVFQELNVEQLIIVSHEPKIESFVENVIKFKRDKNVTVVER